MRGTRVALAVTAAALLVPVSALAVPPTGTGSLEYNSTDQSSLVAKATVTSGTVDYFEVWLNQQSGPPSNIQFESARAPGITGNCTGGVQQDRGYATCSQLSPPATPGTVLTMAFKLPENYVPNGGAQIFLGSAGEFLTIPVSGPDVVATPPEAGEESCEELKEKIKRLKEKISKEEDVSKRIKLRRHLKRLKEKLKKCKGEPPPGAPGTGAS
jgi:hypothetical protein